MNASARILLFRNYQEHVMTDPSAEARDRAIAESRDAWQLIVELRSWLAIAVVRGFTADEVEQIRKLMERSRK